MLRRLALLAVLSSTWGALAQDAGGLTAEETSVSSGQKPLSVLIDDLTSSTASNRLYAARSLRSQLRNALRLEAHGQEGSLVRDEALSRLVEIEARVPYACMSALEFDNVVPACADMLAMLGVEDAPFQLQGARERATRESTRRRIDRALACLGGTGCCPQETASECSTRAAAAPAAPPTP